ncbi:MAG: hypothetical protein ING69_09725 [Rhodocyclaceae bacterium]|nr:hypothetical protein [Rhodocyclaceae bacterium]MCA3082918.1 hypothetical protein [Rhodocyclaceae bacterium]MCA3087465.1 hypothetical protein [Rhodocyclaceae bacterium]
MKITPKLIVILATALSGLFAAGCSAPASDKPVLLGAVNLVLNASLVFAASPVCSPAPGQTVLNIVKASAPASQAALYFVDAAQPAALKHKQLPDLQLLPCVKSRGRPSLALDIRCSAKKGQCDEYQRWLDEKYPAGTVLINSL